MLVELMTPSAVYEHLTHETVCVALLFRMLGEMEDASPAGEVILVGVVLNVGYGSHLLRGIWVEVAHWIAEVVCKAAKSVDLEFLEHVTRQLIEEPVNDHASFNTALRVQHQDDLSFVLIEECLLHQHVTVSNVLRGVEQSALDQTLDEIENNASPIDY